MRETDLIMGRFADACIGDLTEGDLDEYERLLDVPDRDLYAWVVGEYEPPQNYDTPLFHKLRDFNMSRKT